jgi:hypothetical protein
MTLEQTTMQTQGGEGMSQVQYIETQSRTRKSNENTHGIIAKTRSSKQIHVYMKGGRGIGFYLEALDGRAAAKIKVRVGRLVKQRQMRRVAHHRVDGLVRARGGTASE